MGSTGATRRAWLGITGIALAGACAPRAIERPAHSAVHETREAADILVATTSAGIAAIDMGAGHILFTVAHAVPAVELSRLFSTASTAVDGAATYLRTLDIRTGDVQAVVRLGGELIARVASVTGRLVALTEPHSAGAGPYMPGRAGADDHCRG